LRIVSAEPIHARSVTGVLGPGASEGDFAEPGLSAIPSFNGIAPDQRRFFPPKRKAEERDAKFGP